MLECLNAISWSVMCSMKNTNCKFATCKDLGLDFRATPIPNFNDTSSTKYCYQMYSQVPVLILIHGSTIECAVKINFVFDVLA